MSNNKKLFFISSFLLFFLFPQKIWAMTVDFEGLPTSVNTDQEISVTVNLECPSCSDSYLRGAFYESGTSYFGSTQNNSGSWIATTSDKINYFKVAKEDFTEASWSGQLKVKIDGSDSNLNGPKNYFFKVARYTASGGATWSSEKEVYINAPTPSPSPSPEQSSTTSPTSTPSPTKTPTPKPVATKKPTTKPTSTSESESSESGFVLSDISIGDSDPTSTPEGLVAGASTSKFPFQAVGLIVSGVGFMGYGGFSLYKRSKNQYNDDSAKDT